MAIYVTPSAVAVAGAITTAISVIPSAVAAAGAVNMLSDSALWEITLWESALLESSSWESSLWESASWESASWESALLEVAVECLSFWVRDDATMAAEMKAAWGGFSTRTYLMFAVLLVLFTRQSVHVHFALGI
jgi:hypothetical protein